MSDPIEKPEQTDVATESEGTIEPRAEVPDEAVTAATDTEPQDEAAEEPVPAEASSTTMVARPARQVRQPRVPRGPVQYAVIKTGGKQYRVSVGDKIAVERLAVEAGKDVTLDEVLLMGGDGSTKIGTPVVAGASVTAHIDDHFRGEKLVIFKYKAKKRYRRRTGHRQELTRLTITSITG